MEKITIIVPCFNESKTLPILYNSIKEVVDKIEMDYELLLINDGSTDGTLEVIKSLCENDKK